MAGVRPVPGTGGQVEQIPGTPTSWGLNPRGQGARGLPSTAGRAEEELQRHSRERVPPALGTAPVFTWGLLGFPGPQVAGSTEKIWDPRGYLLQSP